MLVTISADRIVTVDNLQNCDKETIAERRSIGRAYNFFPFALMDCKRQGKNSLASLSYNRAMTEYCYRAFISYSHQDEKNVRWLHNSLERYRVPKRLVSELGLPAHRLTPIFRDRDELSSAARLSDVIQEALEASENLIVVCSEAAAKSKWVNEEVKAFKALGRGDRIFCLIVDGKDGSVFPEALRDQEPLAADIRPGADGRNDAKLKLIASLLDIAFGKLKDREHKKRVRLLGFAAAASILITGVMTALAISAELAKREAERSRAIAAEALEESEAVAGFLSAMLTELNPEAMGETILRDVTAQAPGVGLDGVNGTNTARLLLDEHLLTVASDSVAEQFSDQPLIHARLDQSIGSAYYAIGLYERSMQSFNRATERFATVLGADSVQALEAQNDMAGAALYDGRLDEAAGLFERALALATRVHGEGSDVSLSAMNGLAVTYTDMRRLEEARSILERIIPVLSRSNGEQHQRTLQTRNNLVWVLYLLEEYDVAESRGLELLEIHRGVYGPEHTETLTALNNLALIYRAQGRLAEARSAHTEEFEIAKRVLGDDHPEVLVSMLNLSRVIYMADDLVAAEQLIADCRRRAISALPEVHPLLAAITTLHGDILRDSGRRDEALALFIQSRGIYAQIHEPGHPRFGPIDERIAALESAP